MHRDDRGLAWFLGALLIATGLLAYSLFGCQPSVAPMPPSPTTPQPWDAAAPGDCERACDRYREMGCDEARPTPGGSTCETVCRNFESTFPGAFGVECVLEADSCEDVRDCRGQPP